ncbi:MAG: hypothetical protein JWM25_520 [Thermoleophilia bacterium]|nr:hypothetical protein [Thermoleophilia bacterium]
MTAPVSSALPVGSTLDARRIQVVLRGRNGAADVHLGTAGAARASVRLTMAERAAIDALVRAVQLLRERVGLAGIDDAGTAVKLILRDSDATANGPWATTGSLAVGTRNALAKDAGPRGRAGILLTVDSAIHELVHVVQFGRMATNAKPNGAILEGIADAAALLATNDDTLGEEFFAKGPDGRHQGAIRELGSPRISGMPLGPTIRRYREASAKGAEVHAAGGVVSETFILLRRSLGRDQAEVLLWRVIRDATAWRQGGTWATLASALTRAAAAMGGTAPAAMVAALRTTGLDAALPAAAPAAVAA